MFIKYIYDPTLTYGHELWAVNKRIRFQVEETGKRKPANPEHAIGIISLDWPWNTLGSPQDELEEEAREKDLWVSLLSLLPPQPSR